MAVYSLDPLQDPRWSDFVERHRSASLVHTTGWLKALRQTYGYRPVVFTTSQPSTSLENGVVLCRVKSWLTGRRLVSLPFADHCDVLIGDAAHECELLEGLQDVASRERLKYVELRSRGEERQHADWNASSTFSFHELDLRPSIDELFKAAHKTGVQQPIRRAEREGLTCDEGRSEKHIQEFYRLLLLTRRRHGLPPQPIQWFRNLAAALGDRLTIRVASKASQTVASILTLRWGGTICYKYGCSDARFHNLGGVAFLLWKTIQEAKQTDARSLDFGRSDLDNSGLITFKDRWGARKTSLNYIRHSAQPQQRLTESGGAKLVKQAFPTCRT